MPTKQETFDTVARHLLRQGRKSWSDERDMCMYRGDDGLKCAVGCLIPDGEYSPSIERKSVNTVVISELLRRLGHDLGLCYDLQVVHDATIVTLWENDLRCVAKHYGLEFKLAEYLPATNHEVQGE